MNPRYRALELILSRPTFQASTNEVNLQEMFGANVFDRNSMQAYLPAHVFEEVIKVIEEGQTLQRSLAEPVAHAMKAWAVDRGVGHFSHWFQPLTGMAAEKHESFLDINNGRPIETFSGDELSQQEPDASSFPSGGLRSTFEARGYTAWDVSSPAFILETTYGKTLCIPTIFVSYKGESLDYKIPLLKSVALLDEAATNICRYFDPEVKRVVPTLGLEQEFFLIDRAYFELRQDLVLTGRTLLGSPLLIGQQKVNHYFGSISERVFAFLSEMERECLRLGIPLRTRHNEVAPAQFECAPIFEPINLALDHGLMMMDVVNRVALKHNFNALLHEKPFANINGSGKHNNWSMMTNTGKNLLSPGSKPEENLMFLAFFTAVIRGVFEHANLLQAVVSSSGNDLRLGGMEAPPPVMSVFVGKSLSKVLDDIENPPRKKKTEELTEHMKLGIREIPELLLDNTDRNRTSPFAFTGNKFELRTVGSSANSSLVMAILNLSVADQLMKMYHRIESKMKRGRKVEAAILDMVKDNISASKVIRFEGDNYSARWIREARKRGLKLLSATPFALDSWLDKSSKDLFNRLNIFSENEISARYNILQEQYCQQLTLEAAVIKDMVQTQVLPASMEYAQALLQQLKDVQTLSLDPDLAKSSRDTFESLQSLNNNLHELCTELSSELENAKKKKDVSTCAKYLAERVVPVFVKIRENTDKLEEMIPDKLWPLPKYKEMLFAK